jgi:hypothetical protein
MGMAMKADETLLYVLTPDPIVGVARINIFEPGGGKHCSSYFFGGADFFNGENSFSYHIKSLNIDTNTELLFVTGL